MSCCRDAPKDKAFEEARNKMHRETDLAEMVQTLRMVKFMRQLNEDKGEFSDLVRYSKQYRVEVPDGAVLPQKRNAQVDMDSAKANRLTGENHLQEVLMEEIAGRPTTSEAQEVRGTVVADQNEVTDPLL